MSAGMGTIGLVQKAAIYFMMLVFVGHVAELHPALSFRGWGVLASLLGLFAAGSSRNRQSLGEILKESPLFKFVLVFMTMVYFSVPFAVYKSGALASAIAYGYVVIFFFSLVIIAKGEDGLKTLMNAGLLVFIVLSAGVIINYGSARTSLSNSSYDPNDIAYILVTLLPLMFYYSQLQKNTAKKVLILGALLIAVVSISLTQSRGAVISFVVMLALILRFEKVSFTKVVLPGILLVLLTMYFVPEAFWDRLSTLTNIESDYNYTSEDGRLHLWKIGIGLFFKHIISGVGAGQFTSANGMFEGNYMTAHNAYVQAGAELGLVGLVSFCFMTLGPLGWLKRRINLARECGDALLPMYKGLYVSFFVHAVAIFFLSVAYYFTLYFILALFFAMVCMNANSETVPCARKESGKARLAPKYRMKGQDSEVGYDSI